MASEQEMQALQEVVDSVLEQFAFMFVEPGDEDSAAEAVGTEFLRTRIRFRGPRAGALCLIAPDNACEELAANILGMDEDPGERQGAEALKELTNIICGELVAKLFGPQIVVDLSIPEITALSREQWTQCVRDDATLCLTADEEPLLVQLAFDEEEETAA